MDYRKKVLITCPKECRKFFRAYMRKRDIKFIERRSHGKLLFVVDRKLRPLAWKTGCPCDNV